LVIGRYKKYTPAAGNIVKSDGKKLSNGYPEVPTMIALGNKPNTTMIIISTA